MGHIIKDLLGCCFEGARLQPRHKRPLKVVIPSDARPNDSKGARARDLQVSQLILNCRFLASRSLRKLSSRLLGMTIHKHRPFGTAEAAPLQRGPLLTALQLAALFIVSTFLLGADPSGARFENLGHKLMCRCGCSEILLECNHVGCSYSEKMRQELLAGLQGPDSDDLVLQRFVQEYGGVVLAAPTNTGFNRVAWITPFAALGAGMFAAVYVVRRWKLRQARVLAPSATAPAVSVELDSFRERARKETEL